MNSNPCLTKNGRLSHHWLKTIALLIFISKLLACSVKPGSGVGAGSDIIQPLWHDESAANRPTDTLSCRKVIALLIGIGQYDPASGWETLNTQNDVSLMEATLRKKGVPLGQIHCLTDQQATKAGIENALKMLADTVRQGSQLIVLYAGHARQLPDDNGDEEDGYDEAIVPYNAPMANQSKPDGYFRDDDLNYYLTSIRAALGPAGSLWLLFDACHSQTLNRGQPSQLMRGGMAPLRLSTQLQRMNSTALGTGSGWYETRVNQGSLAPYILFSATTDGGFNFETTDASGQSFGPLTRAICEVWRNHSLGNYRQLFERMSVMMSRYAPYQQPGMEGDADALTPGCGTVLSTSVSEFRTIGERVRIAWPLQDATLTHALRTLPFVQLAGKHPDLRVERRNRNYRLILAATNQSVSKNGLSAEECIEKIQQYFARNVLMQLQQTNPDFQLKITMQRVAVRTVNGRTILTDTLPNLSTRGLPTFRATASERMVLTLVNTGTKPFYLTVVDLRPDGSLHVLLPETGFSTIHYHLLPGRSLNRRIRITEPYGAEVYKLLLTSEPIDLREILQTRGNYPAQHPYETIFRRTYALRGIPETAPAKLSERAGATAEVAFWAQL